jgi:hypothetical protein
MGLCRGPERARDCRSGSGRPGRIGVIREKGINHTLRREPIGIACQSREAATCWGDGSTAEPAESAPSPKLVVADREGPVLTKSARHGPK